MTTPGRAALLHTLELNNFPKPSVARTLSPNGRAHHMARYHAIQAVQIRVALDARMQGLPQMRDGLVVVRPIWTFPITRKHDSDNLSTGVLKACLDALVRGRWLLDDSSEHVRLEPPVIRVERGRRALVLEFWA
jgi:Holliday junction resolvase RusA-like endonuclease